MALVLLAIAADELLVAQPTRFWMTVLGGMLSDTTLAAYADARPRHAAVASLVAVLLNTGLLALIVGILTRVARVEGNVARVERKLDMRLTHAVAIKEADLMARLEKKLEDRPDVVEIIKESFRAADKDWPDILADVYGERDARRILNVMEDVDPLQDFPSRT